MINFVWITGLNGPEPQIWYTDQTRDGKPVPTLQKHEINEAEAALGLKVLAMVYPYEAKS